MAYKFSAAHNRTKAIISSCVTSGAGIEFLPDAPRFRYTPPDNDNRPLHNGKPSSRGTVGTPTRFKYKNFPTKGISLDPAYNTPMRGDSDELTKARKAWHNGNPKPLRDYLSNYSANVEKGIATP